MAKENNAIVNSGIDIAVDTAIETIIAPMMKALGPLAPVASEAGNYLGDALDKGIDYVFDNIINSKK